MKKLLSKFILKLFGWKVAGELPKEAKKFVLIGAPHTSNWDFLFSRAAMYLFDIKMRYLIKDDYFKGPAKYFFKATGGLPVDRSKTNNLVETMIELFESKEELALLIPPEGTRKAVERWKTGFYHVAVGAKVPILLGYLDYKTKTAGFGTLFYPSGNKQEDFQKIEDFYRKITPKNAIGYNTSIFERQ